ATNPQAPPLLTINVPIGLQFGATTGEFGETTGGTPVSTRGGIRVEGGGHNLTRDENEAVISTNRPDGLKVKPGNTLALVGGDLSLEGGNLTVTGGIIEVWSVVSGQLLVVSNNGKLNIENGENNIDYGNIQLSNAASVYVSGNGGEIYLSGRRVLLRDGSAILAISREMEQAGVLAVKASDSVEAIGNTITADNKLFRSGLLSQVFDEGKAADLIVETGRLIVNGGDVAAFTFGSRDAGNVTVRASDFVELIGSETEDNSITGLSSQVKPGATGNGGNLLVETQRLIVREGAQVSTITLGDGRGGNIIIRADQSVELISSADDLFASGVLTQSEPGSTGNSGNLTIITGELKLLDGAEISASTSGSGNAGDLFIRASDLVQLSGSSGGYSSGIFAQANDEATGNAGNLTIETRQLSVRDGGQISTSTEDIGRGGNLTVRGVGNTEADLVELSGISPEPQGEKGIFTPSSLLATTNGTMEKAGNGGNLIINARRLIVQDGAQVAASTLGTGAGGSVTVNASESVELIGIKISPNNDTFQSSLLARTRSPGTGAAGNIEVNSPLIFLADRALITTDTRSGDFGNIELTSNNIQLRQNSSITTNTDTSTGGNITINTDTIAALENSDITANAARGFGGRVTVNTQGIFGTAYRENLSEITSDITATSELGPQFNGVVEINTPDVDPTQGLLELPQDFAPSQVTQNLCSLVGEKLEFIYVGRGGLPPNPREALNLGVEIDRSSSDSATQQIVEAQGWIVGENGEIILTDKLPAMAYGSLYSVACRAGV
ncbi:S-layer family protein, partial [Planktothrix sp. FACHB-1355]